MNLCFHLYDFVCMHVPVSTGTAFVESAILKTLTVKRILSSVFILEAYSFLGHMSCGRTVCVIQC